MLRALVLGMTTTNEIRTETIHWLTENCGSYATIEQIETALQWATDSDWEKWAELEPATRWDVVAESSAQRAHPDPNGFGALPKSVGKVLGAIRQALMDHGLDVEAETE